MHRMLERSRYVVRDKATQGADFMVYGYNAKRAAITLMHCLRDGIRDQVECVIERELIPDYQFC